MSNDQYLSSIKIDLQSYLLLKSGSKPCIRMAISHQKPENIIMYSKKLGLHALVKRFKSLYGKALEKPIHNAYFSLSMDTAIKAYESERNGDRKALGEILGYPECCVDSFINNLTKPKPDFILHAYMNTSTYPRFCCNNLFVFDSKVGIEYPVYYEKNKEKMYNMEKLFLIRHVPCSYECKESIAIGNETLRLLKEHDQDFADRIVSALKRQVVYFDPYNFAVFDGNLRGDELAYKGFFQDLSLLDDSVLEKIRQGDRVRAAKEKTLIMKGSEILLELDKKCLLMDFR